MLKEHHLGVCLGNPNEINKNNDKYHRDLESSSWECFICLLLFDFTKCVFPSQHLRNASLCSMSPATKIIKLTYRVAKESALGVGNKQMRLDTVIVMLPSTLCGTLDLQNGPG